jgi:hypothetical protein
MLGFAGYTDPTLGFIIDGNQPLAHAFVGLVKFHIAGINKVIANNPHPSTSSGSGVLSLSKG